MSGPKPHLRQGWGSLRKGLQIGPEGPLAMYLGCAHGRGTIKLPDGLEAACVTYNMEDFLGQCVERYMVATKHSVKLKKADTPVLVEDQKSSMAGGGSRTRAESGMTLV